MQKILYAVFTVVFGCCMQTVVASSPDPTDKSVLSETADSPVRSLRKEVRFPTKPDSVLQSPARMLLEVPTAPGCETSHDRFATTLEIGITDANYGAWVDFVESNQTVIATHVVWLATQEPSVPKCNQHGRKIAVIRGVIVGGSPKKPLRRRNSSVPFLSSIPEVPLQLACTAAKAKLVANRVTKRAWR